MIIIPPRETKKLTQNNRSNLLGNIWSTFNIDLESNLGVIRVSPRLKLNTNGLDGCPWNFRFFDTKIWAGAGTLIYGNGGDPNNNFTADASTGFQSDYSSDESDMEVFNGTLCATTTDALVSKAADGFGAGAWTSRDTLNTGAPHMLSYFKKYDRLYYSNQSDNILSISTSWVTADPGTDYAISLSTDSTAYFITCHKPTSQSIFIGVLDRTKEGASGKILEWNGISSQVTREYPLIAQGCMAIVVNPKTDVPYAMDSNGVLLEYRGYGFEEVGRLPVNTKLLKSINDPDNERFIHPNGLTVTREGKIRALVNNLNVDGTYNENFQAGVYEFDLNGSCIHVESPSYTTSSTITDYGQSRISRVGAIASMNVYSAAANRNGTYMYGATYYTNASSTSSGIFYNDSNNTLRKYGYFITTWILSQNLVETWQKISTKYRQLLASTDKITVKYRKTEAAPLDISITWSSTSSISTATDITGYEIGDEIEIVQGSGSGLCAHLTSTPVLVGSVYNVNIDETFTGVDGTAKARMQKWKKILTVDNQDTESKGLELDVTSERVQLKVCMQFSGDDELFELILTSDPHEKL